MQKLVLLFSVLILFSFEKATDKDQVVFDRIEYIYHLKHLVDEDIWLGFAHKKYDLPLVYYTDSICYIANPTEKFILIYEPVLAFKSEQLAIYKTPLLDSIPFHMETSMTFGTSSEMYNHRSPFMNCSSFEISQKVVPHLECTEQWATMVIHEYFHGYQFKHAEHLDYFGDNIAVIPADSLKKIYKTYAWFKEGVDTENSYLLSALNTTELNEVHKLIGSFFQLREERRLQTKQQLKFDITPIEQSFETMEGTARYVEYSLYSKFADKHPNSKLTRSDTSYHAYRYFRDYSIEKDEWLYLTEKTSYFYATGFNTVRLLEKLGVDYQTRVFKEGGLSLEEILKQYWKEKTASNLRKQTK